MAASSLRRRPSIPVPPARPSRAGAGQKDRPAGSVPPQQLRSYVVGPHATKAAAALDELRQLAAAQGELAAAAFLNGQRAA